jgi:hypothetical protein
MSSFTANTARTEVLESGKKVTFISQTNDKFEVPVEHTMCSNLVKESLEMGKDDANPEVPLPNISTPTLLKVIEFMGEYTREPFKVLPRPLPKNGLADCVGPFYLKFIENCEMVSDSLRNNSRKTGDDESASGKPDVPATGTSIVELLLAGTFLQIDGLKQLTTAFMASNLREKNFIEVKKMFKCEDLQFDHRKMEQLHKDHAWCFEAKAPTPNNNP